MPHTKSATIHVSTTIETARTAGAPQEPVDAPIAPLVAAMSVWLAGTAIGSVAFVIGIRKLARVTSTAREVYDGPWHRVGAELSATTGLRRRVAMLQTDAPDLLATWGVFRPCVLLPNGAADWSEDRVGVVLRHELEHVQRLDWVVQTAAELVRTIYWFNPLVWIACAQLRRDSEQACDDAVLGGGVPAHAYAAHLLELARICRGPRVAWSSAMLMARPSTFERRISAMLNPDLDRQRLTRRTLIATAAGLLAITLPVAAYHAEQTTPLALRGTVYDSTGAVLPQVSVTLIDARLEDAQQQTKPVATTNAAGRFEFAPVSPGRYILEASAPAFRSLRQEITLSRPSDWDRAITLGVGAVQETITVSAPRPTGTKAPSQAAPKQIRVGGNIRPPTKVLDVRPIYPESMRAAGREGTVSIETTIARDGTVGALRVLSADVHPDFALAAADAVRQWRFNPTLLNGEPVEVVMMVSVTFSLSN
jgi:TonB family protein